MSISLEQANQAIAAALSRARSGGAKISVSVCDDRGHLIAHQRMDGTPAEASRASIGKAMQSAAAAAPSDVVIPSLASGSLAVEAVLSGQVPSWPTRGGLPIRHNQMLQGAIGVAGASTLEQNEDCARAGVEASEGEH